MRINNWKKLSIKTKLQVDLLVHACSPGTLEAATRRLPQVQGQPGCIVSFKSTWENLSQTTSYSYWFDCSLLVRIKSNKTCQMHNSLQSVILEFSHKSCITIYLYGLFTDENKFNTLTIIIVRKRCIHLSSFKKSVFFPNDIYYP